MSMCFVGLCAFCSALTGAQFGPPALIFYWKSSKHQKKAPHPPIPPHNRTITASLQPPPVPPPIPPMRVTAVVVSLIAFASASKETVSDASDRDLRKSIELIPETFHESLKTKNLFVKFYAPVRVVTIIVCFFRSCSLKTDSFPYAILCSSTSGDYHRIQLFVTIHIHSLIVSPHNLVLMFLGVVIASL